MDREGYTFLLQALTFHISCSKGWVASSNAGSSNLSFLTIKLENIVFVSELKRSAI